MKPWQIHLERALSAPDAPPALTRDLLARFACSARNGIPIPASTLTHWLKIALAREKLDTVQRGLYLNRFRAIPGRLADTTPLLRADAVVSLNTVLGEAGVLNNPSNTITAVVPIDANAPPPRLGKLQTRAGTFRFFGLPRRILEAGTSGDRLENAASLEHPRATPEKALIDWLYLAQSPRSKRTAPPWNDIDCEMLNQARLRRLTEAVGLNIQR
jgi:hypothetical protein